MPVRLGAVQAGASVGLRECRLVIRDTLGCGERTGRTDGRRRRVTDDGQTDGRTTTTDGRTSAWNGSRTTKRLGLPSTPSLNTCCPESRVGNCTLAILGASCRERRPVWARGCPGASGSSTEYQERQGALGSTRERQGDTREHAEGPGSTQEHPC
jgi:hypothetical protein